MLSYTDMYTIRDHARENSLKASSARAIIKFAGNVQIAEIVSASFICDHCLKIALNFVISEYIKPNMYLGGRKVGKKHKASKHIKTSV